MFSNKDLVCSNFGSPGEFDEFQRKVPKALQLSAARRGLHLITAQNWQVMMVFALFKIEPLLVEYFFFWLFPFL